MNGTWSIGVGLKDLQPAVAASATASPMNDNQPHRMFDLRLSSNVFLTR
jgi:hypothetical protein